MFSVYPDGDYMSREIHVDLKELRARIKRAQIPDDMLAFVFRISLRLGPVPLQHAVNDILYGRKKITYAQLLSIADMLQCEVYDLMS